MTPKKLPEHVRRKVAKGRVYYYFNTSRKDDNGKPILKRLPSEPGKAEFSAAYAVALRVRNQVTKPPKSVLTISGLIRLFELSTAYKRNSEATQVNYSHFLKRIVAEMGEAPAAAVERKDAMTLMDKYAATPAAANQMVRVLGALYAWGRQREHLPKDARPCEDIELFETGEHEPWPEWLLNEALKADDELVSLATHLLYFTAQRLGDTLRMRWTDIEDGRIKVRQQKTDNPLKIKLDAPLAAKLSETPRRGFTILSDAKGLPLKASVVRRRLQKFAAERGLQVVPHGLRKNAVIALLEAGCSTWEVQAISGQSPATVEHYAKMRDKTRLGDAAILRMESKRKERK